MNPRLILHSSRLFFAVCATALATTAEADSVIVAAANSSPQAKARADIVCDGTNDQIKLLDSFTRAPRIQTVFDSSPNTLQHTKCYGPTSVEWLPGDYSLGGTLVIPDGQDCVIDAEGARFHYAHKTGDAVVIRGMMRCRYRFGVIYTESDGTALRIKPTTNMPAEMSIVGFTGLIGTNQKGIGLCVNSSVCTMRFEGTDIREFNIGVFVPNDDSGKTDTDWYWFSYVRMCNTCIWEQHNGIDSAFWFVNVDASIPNSVAIRTAAIYGHWFVIMGTMDWFNRSHENNRTRSIILDPGAKDNVMEVTPPLAIGFAPAENNSGNNSNVILCTNRPMALTSAPVSK